MTPSADTREAILDAAEALFARQGFGPTTIKHLGAAAEVNPALLYYYFADKDALYAAVLDRVLTRFAAGGGQRLADAPSPSEAVRGFVDWQVEALLSRPHLPGLIAREMLDHGAQRAEAPLTRLAAGLFERLCRIVEEGQRRGEFRSDIDPRHAAMSIVSQVVYCFIARPAVGLLLGYGIGRLPDDEVRRFGRHAADFALAALAPPAVSA